MMSVKLLICCLFVLLSFSGNAQIFLGITADLGNQVSPNPSPEYLLKCPITPSGSLMLLARERIREQWYLQYGFTMGTLGYRINFKDFIDTLSTVTENNFYSKIPNYNTIYGSVNLTFGREFNIWGKWLTFYLGGGTTYYFESQVSGTASACEVIPCVVVFQYEMRRKDKNTKGFIELSAQTALTPSVLIGLRYRHHFNPGLKGDYNFYHIKEPHNGSLSLTQRYLSLLLMIKFHK